MEGTWVLQKAGCYNSIRHLLCFADRCCPLLATYTTQHVLDNVLHVWAPYLLLDITLDGCVCLASILCHHNGFYMCLVYVATYTNQHVLDNVLPVQLPYMLLDSTLDSFVCLASIFCHHNSFYMCFVYVRNYLKWHMLLSMFVSSCICSPACQCAVSFVS